jgi:hypothetical protein
VVGQSPLCVRGFPDVWCNWIQQLQETAKSAVLLNGVPGRWIPCRKGLRQGDPLSSYLFILVADVLQRMLTRDAALHHPLAPDRPCVVLQYADDTLIVRVQTMLQFSNSRRCYVASLELLVCPSTTPRARWFRCTFLVRMSSPTLVFLAAPKGLSPKRTWGCLYPMRS